MIKMEKNQPEYKTLWIYDPHNIINPRKWPIIPPGTNSDDILPHIIEQEKRRKDRKPLYDTPNLPRGELPKQDNIH